MSNDYTGKQKEFLRQHSGLSRREIVKKFNDKYGENRTLSGIRGMCFRSGWMTGRTGCFEKGHVPHDAGSAGTGLMKPNKTSFKKGNRPKNAREVGLTRIDNRYGYLMIKVSESRKWRFVHNLIWEEAHGKIPAGMIVKFINGRDKDNPRLDNLELVSRAELLQRNQLNHDNMPDEIKPTTALIAKLKVKVGECGKGDL